MLNAKCWVASLRPRRVMLGSRRGRCNRRSPIHARARIGAVRRRGRGFRVRRGRLRGHRALRIQQMVMGWPQPQADQSARVRDGLRLPAVIGLIAPHGLFTGLIPPASRFAAQVVLPYQRFLDGLRPLRVNLLLTPRCLPLALARSRVLRFAVVSCSNRTRLWVLACRRMRRGVTLGRRGRARSRSLRGSRVFLRVYRLGLRRGLRAAACFRVRSRRLPQCSPRRGAGTNQGHGAARAQPSSYFRAMLRFQRQPSEDQRPVFSDQ